MANVLKELLARRIVAIARDIKSKDIIKLAEAIEKGGVKCLEITFDQSSEEALRDTTLAIRILKEAMGDRMLVGAGTVLTVSQVREAVAAGAEYIVSPNINDEVIRETKRLGKVSVPGAMTPSELARAYETGADIVKLFPASFLGIPYIKAIRAPLRHIPLMATGGVNADNCADFIKAGCVGVGVGGSLVSQRLIDEGRLDEITAAAEAYVKALGGN